jgi:hypothetical protein
MSAHGFLRHVENRPRAAEIYKLLRTAETWRPVHEGVRLTTTEMIDGIAERLISLNVSFRRREVADQQAHVAAPRALNDRCREAHGAVLGHEPPFALSS